MRSSLKVVACVALQPTSCHACWVRNRNTIVCTSVKSLFTVQMLMITFKLHRHRLWNLGLRLWCRNNSPVLAMGFRNRRPDPHKHGKFSPMWKWCWLWVWVCGFFLGGGGGDCQAVINHEFVPRDQSLKKEYYLTVIKSLREGVRSKRPDFLG